MPLFSRNTIIEAVDSLNFQDHASISEFILRFSLEDADVEGGLKPRETSIKKYLVSHSGDLGPSGANLILEIIEYALVSAAKTSQVRRRRFENDPPEALALLARSLQRDGYVIEGVELRRSLPETVEIPEIESEMVGLLERHKFKMSLRHFNQATSAFTRGDWAAANAQLRTFIESLFEEIAYAIDRPNAATKSSSNARREMLATTSPPFFLIDFNDWSTDRGKPGYIQGFWARL